MEHSSHTPMRWRTKIIGAYALTFAAVAVLISYLPFGLSGSSSTIASTFLSSLKASYLPPGWQVILPNSARSEVDAIASILLAFMVCYPIAAYGAIRLVSPPDLGKKTIAALVVGAAFVFYGGAAWGLAADNAYFAASISPYFGLSPIVSGYDFYVLLMRGILGWALVFIAPIFLTFFLESRRARGLRWHL
jgi:hypothetical protein